MSCFYRTYLLKGPAPDIRFKVFILKLEKMLKRDYIEESRTCHCCLVKALVCLFHFYSFHFRYVFSVLNTVLTPVLVLKC